MSRASPSEHGAALSFATVSLWQSQEFTELLPWSRRGTAVRLGVCPALMVEETSWDRGSWSPLVAGAGSLDQPSSIQSLILAEGQPAHPTQGHRFQGFLSHPGSS